MIKVIINADDLGKSLVVNREIGNALSNGYITSSTILANSKYWNDVHNIVDSNPQASFGVHLNLTEGRALTDSSVFRTLGIVDKDNNFTSNIRAQDLSNKELLDAVYYEWDKQIQKVVCEENISVTHIDGHHHIHTDIRLLNVLLRLLQKWNIKYVRGRYNTIDSKGKVFMRRCLALISSNYLYFFLSRNKYFGKFARFKSLLLGNVETIYWLKLVKKKVLSLPMFDSYEHFIRQLSVGYMPSNNVMIELMCHPGHEKYSEEYQMIRSKMLQRYLSDVSLISYRNLNAQ